MRFSFICFPFVFLIPLASAQEETSHPIDTRLNACIETDPSTHGTVACLHIAHDEWDDELNQVYQQLLIELDDDADALLRTTQRQWIAFRDAEFAFMLALYSTRSGSMWQMIHAAERVEIVRDRTNSLVDYLWAMAPD